MRVLFSILTISLAGLFSANAQSLSFGEVYSYDKDFQIQSIPGETDKHIVAVRASADSKTGLIDKVVLEKFNKQSLSLESTVLLEELFSNKQTDYPEAIHIWNDSLCVFSSEYLKEKKAYALKYRVVGDDNKVGQSHVLMESKSTDFTFNKKHFSISVSKRAKYLSVIHFQNGLRKGETDIHLIRYDSLFEVTSEMNAVLPFPGDGVAIEQEITDDAGNLHLLLRGQNEDEDVFSIFAFPVFGNELIEYKLDIPGKQINSVRMSKNVNDQLLVSGLFQENFEQKGKNSGVFFLRIDRESGSVEAKGLSRFDTDLSGLSAGEESIVERGAFEDFKSRSIYSSGKNGAFFIAEVFGEEEVCETDYRNGLLTCNNVYTAGNLLLINLNEQGKVDWFRIVANSQKSIDDGGKYLGTVAVPGIKSDVILINNRSSSTSQKEKTKALSDFRTTEVVIESVNSNGQLDSEKSSSSKDLPILPYSAYYSKEGKVFLISEFEGKSSLLQIKP